MNLDEMYAALSEDMRAASHDLAAVSHDLEQQHKHARSGSSYVGPGADESYAEHVASGGTFSSRYRENKDFTVGRASKGGSSLARGLKALSAGTGSSGGYATFPELAAELLPLPAASDDDDGGSAS